MKTIFNNVTEEEYSKFKVYIMREEDTLDSILLKYNVKIVDITDGWRLFLVWWFENFGIGVFLFLMATI